MSLLGEIPPFVDFQLRALKVIGRCASNIELQQTASHIFTDPAWSTCTEFAREGIRDAMVERWSVLDGASDPSER
jgi:hypothetical protein